MTVRDAAFNSPELLIAESNVYQQVLDEYIADRDQVTAAEIPAPADESVVIADVIDLEEVRDDRTSLVDRIKKSKPYRVGAFAVASAFAAVGVAAPAIALSSGQSTAKPAVSSANSLPTVKTPLAECLEQIQNGEVHFYSTDVPGQEFGPAAPKTSVEAAMTELEDIRLCNDPALLVGLSDYFEFGSNSPYTPEQLLQQRIDITNNRADWEQEYEELTDVFATSKIELTTVSGSYWTEYMKDTEFGPIIYQTQNDMDEMPVLKFILASGAVRILKLDCGYQPVEQEQFKGVPTFEEAFPPETPEIPVCEVDCEPGIVLKVARPLPQLPGGVPADVDPGSGGTPLPPGIKPVNPDPQGYYPGQVNPNKPVPVPVEEPINPPEIPSDGTVPLPPTG